MKSRWTSRSNSCRSCSRAYLRVPGGRFYAWECCGIGSIALQRHMPDDWACEHYQPGEYRPAVEVETVLMGEEVEL